MPSDLGLAAHVLEKRNKVAAEFKGDDAQNNAVKAGARARGESWPPSASSPS
jgi:stage V sporulation protein SpoVS